MAYHINFEPPKTYQWQKCKVVAPVLLPLPITLSMPYELLLQLASPIHQDTIDHTS